MPAWLENQGLDICVLFLLTINEVPIHASMHAFWSLSLLPPPALQPFPSPPHILANPCFSCRTCILGEGPPGCWCCTSCFYHNPPGRLALAYWCISQTRPGTSQSRDHALLIVGVSCSQSMLHDIYSKDGQAAVLCDCLSVCLHLSWSRKTWACLRRFWLSEWGEEAA